ncbi:MAG: alpha/beta hydrolase [Chthoniobacter sp.]|nr:alpha/beta hydrolase [Chthoniobacter sp.]
MKLSCFLLLAFVSSSFAVDLAALRKAAEASAAAHQVEAVFDQPYAGNDNRKQRVDLYLPKQPKSDQPLPVIAYLHGGGWLNGDRIGGFAGSIRYAQTGEYAAVSIGYRLTGEAHWPAQIFDCKAAIRWIRGHAKEYHLDPTKIAITGNSAGGHLASLLGTSGDVKELEGDLGPWTNESSRVTCVVNLCGPEDLTKALAFDKKGGPIVNDGAVVGLLGGTYVEKSAGAVAASPLTYVSSDDPPFLNAQGTEDKRVSYTNAEAIHAALLKAGVSLLLIPITGGGHGSVSNKEIQHRVEQFLALHLRGVPAEISTEPIPAEEPKK